MIMIRVLDHWAAFSQHYVIVTWKQDESWSVSYPLSNNIVSGINEKSVNKQCLWNTPAQSQCDLKNEVKVTKI